MSQSQVLPECIGSKFNCSSVEPECFNTAGFNFRDMWNITQQYWDQCPGGPWLFREPGFLGDVHQDKASLTNTACEAIAGASWTRYTNADVWYRLTTWKFPLFQLVFLSPRAPLGFWEEAFSVVHFLGDPVGSATDLIRKIDSCQRRAVHWRDILQKVNLEYCLDGAGNEICRKRLQKALTLIVISYDEWGESMGTAVEQYIEREIFDLNSGNTASTDRDRFIGFCLEAADQLAADRSTKFLPVIIAQAFFIGTIVIAIVRTGSLAQGPNPQAYIDVETYSIGFSALYFWVISTVTLASIIGSSQTAGAIPNILSAFRRNLSQAFPGREIELPRFEDFDEQQRYRSGGIYSWQPDGAFRDLFRNAARRVYHLSHQATPTQRRRSSGAIKFHQSWPWFCAILPILSVSFGTIIGMVITYLVPPKGWSCRSSAEIAIFAVWILSYPLTLIRWGHHHRFHFWFTFSKDFLAMGATLGIVIATQIGVLNKCSCYTLDGATGLALPQIPAISAVLQHRLQLHYPAITVVGILLQLVVYPGIILSRYFEAVRVFLQRDDGQSNITRCYRLCLPNRSTSVSVKSAISRNKSDYGQSKIEDPGEINGVTEVEEIDPESLGSSSFEIAKRSKSVVAQVEMLGSTK